MTTTTCDQLFTFFGLRQNPFGVSPDARFFFSAPAHESALAELLFAIQTRQGLMVLTGEAGAGKTTLLQQLLDTLHKTGVSSSYVFHSRLDAEDLFHFILRDFGVDCPSRRKGDMIHALHDWLVQRHSAGDTPVVVIDEAHVLPTETIDDLRLLLNLESAGGKLVQLILAGQPELDEQLRRPELRQLRQRVMFRCKLPLLTREETARYLRFRLASAGTDDAELFPVETVDAVFEYSRGIPRTINLLGEHALINAYAEHHRAITPESIRYIASDFDLLENPLSVNRDSGPMENPQRARFPLPKPDPRSLSGLRMMYLSELSLREQRPSMAQERPGFTEEEPLPFAKTASPAARGFAPVSAEKETAPVAPQQGPALLAAESHLMKPEEFPARFAAPAEGDRKFSAQESGSDGFVRYWRAVASSFQRDAIAFYVDCARAVRGTWGRTSGPSPKVQPRHF